MIALSDLEHHIDSREGYGDDQIIIKTELVITSWMCGSGSKMLIKGPTN